MTSHSSARWSWSESSQPVTTQWFDVVDAPSSSVTVIENSEGPAVDGATHCTRPVWGSIPIPAGPAASAKDTASAPGSFTRGCQTWSWSRGA